VELKKRKLTALPAKPRRPRGRYHLDSGKGSLVFTRGHDHQRPLWVLVNKIANLKYLIIETAFCNREKELAVISKHLCPSMLAEELAKLERSAESTSRI